MVLWPKYISFIAIVTPLLLTVLHLNVDVMQKKYNNEKSSLLALREEPHQNQVRCHLRQDHHTENFKRALKTEIKIKS